jgi:hypothetical protein
VDWLRSDRGYPNPDHDPLYEVLLTQLLLSGRQTTANLGAVQELFVARLSVTVSAKEYEMLLSGIVDVAGDLVGTRTINWLFDLAEFTVRYPCPNKAARSAFWMSLLALLQPLASRLSRSQVAMAQDLATVLGARELVDDWVATTVVDVPTAAPRHTYIGIYCLREEISRRVKLALESDFPGIRIELNSDQDNSPRLRELARRAELSLSAGRPLCMPPPSPSRLHGQMRCRRCFLAAWGRPASPKRCVSR